MNKHQITAYPRPYLPHEHPKLADHLRLFSQNIRHHLSRKHCFDNQHTSQLIQSFTAPADSFEDKFVRMARYFIQAFFYYAGANYCRIRLPGLPSEQGRDSDAIEACARTLPLLAVWLNYRQRRCASLTADDEKIRRALSQALLQGTDNSHKTCWGKITDYDQRICEAADIALALWLSRDYVWRDYTQPQRQQIISWLAQINHCRTVDNNWHLFIILCQQIIRALSGAGETDPQRYSRIKQFYTGAGWFRDGANGNYDYYNSWAFHYSLFWLDQINPEFDRPFIRRVCAEFSQQFRYLFTPCGFPFFGRSACYRLAAPSALMAQAIHSAKADGQTKRIIHTLHEFFIRRGAISAGLCSQGLFKTQPALLDGYSGSGSSLWSLRTLILMLEGGDSCGLWQQPEAALEIERASFDFIIEPIAARVSGIQETQEVIVSFMENPRINNDFQQARLEHQTPGQHFCQQLSGRSTRPKNNLLRKGVTTYSSKLNLYL